MRCKVIILAVVFLLTLCGNAEAKEFVGASPEEVNAYQTVIQSASEEDLDALRRVVYWESARCECPHEVNKAVVETVINRVLSDAFPGTIKAVCTQRGQFVCKNASIPQSVSERIDDAISEVAADGRTVLTGTDYLYFATKKQSCAKDHLWIGETKDGRPVKGKGMYFGREK